MSRSCSPRSRWARRASYLTDNLDVKVLFFNQQPVAVEIPLFVELEVTQTEPGVKGDTAAGGTKPATLESGVAHPGAPVYQ